MSDTDVKIDYHLVQEILNVLADRDDHNAMVATDEKDIITYRKREDDLRTSAQIVGDYAAAVSPEPYTHSEPDNLVEFQMVEAALRKALHWANDERRHPEDRTKGDRTLYRVKEAVERAVEKRANAAPSI